VGFFGVVFTRVGFGGGVKLNIDLDEGKTGSEALSPTERPRREQAGMSKVKGEELAPACERKRHSGPTFMEMSGRSPSKS